MPAEQLKQELYPFSTGADDLTDPACGWAVFDFYEITFFENHYFRNNKFSRFFLKLKLFYFTVWHWRGFSVLGKRQQFQNSARTVDKSPCCRFKKAIHEQVAGKKSFSGANHFAVFGFFKLDKWIVRLEILPF